METCFEISKISHLSTPTAPQFRRFPSGDAEDAQPRMTSAARKGLLVFERTARRSRRPLDACWRTDAGYRCVCKCPNTCQPPLVLSATAAQRCRYETVSSYVPRLGQMPTRVLQGVV